MYVYRSPYVQKGYRLGGIFRGVAKFFRPIARNVVKVFSKPEVKRALKTVGEEAVNTGGDVLIDSLRGNDVEKTLDRRMAKYLGNSSHPYHNVTFFHKP